MKTLFRTFIVFGILYVALTLIEYFKGYQISAEILVGVGCVAIGSIGLLVLKAADKR